MSRISLINTSHTLFFRTYTSTFSLFISNSFRFPILSLTTLFRTVVDFNIYKFLLFNPNISHDTLLLFRKTEYIKLMLKTRRVTILL